MPVKLLKSKWYIVDLDTRCVNVRRHYERFWTAVETARAEGLHRRFTAMRGSHILKHTNTWIIPLTIEEAFDEYMDELVSGTFYRRPAEPRQLTEDWNAYMELCRM